MASSVGSKRKPTEVAALPAAAATEPLPLLRPLSSSHPALRALMGEGLRGEGVRGLGDTGWEGEGDVGGGGRGGVARLRIAERRALAGGGSETALRW